MPPIGKADHDIKVKRIKQASLKTYHYKRADMDGLEGDKTQFKNAYLSEDHSHVSFTDMTDKFKTAEAVKMFIPLKMTKTNILCHEVGCNDRTACKEKTFVLVHPRTLMSRFITSS